MAWNLTGVQRFLKLITGSNERAVAAVKSLEDAARRAPFIRKLSNWPLAGTTTARLKHDIETIANNDYQGFLEQFSVVELGYEGVDLGRIMSLYDWQLPPFSERKKAEFPDAIAVASILHYQSSHDDPIAVISKDSDFQSVCDQHAQLLYFPSLAAFAEALNSEDARVEAIQIALANNDDEVRKSIDDAFRDSGFYIEADWDGDVSDPEILEFESIDYHVVGIGQDTCTIAFDAVVIYAAHVSYDDYDTAVYDGGDAYPIHQITGTAQDKASVSGVIKLRTSEGGTTIEEVHSAQLDQKDFTISSRPDEYY
jgi:hypothetical protein